MAGTRGDGRSAFGQVSKLPTKSGRYRARYVGPDGVRHSAPTTFDDRATALMWLKNERALVEDLDTWTPPKERAAARNRNRLTFATYADSWLEQRTLKPRTRAHYRSLLDQHLLPAFGDLPIAGITTEAVKQWHHRFGSSRPTLRSHCYALLRTVLGEAEREELIRRNPCHIRGAGNTKRVRPIKPAGAAQLQVLVAAMPERHQVLTLLAAWCGLRFGELTELRRRDVDLKAGLIHVERAVTRVDGQVIVGKPKSDAGVRNVAIPPHLLPAVKDHLRDHAAWGRDGLLFPGSQPTQHLAPSTLYGRATTPRRQGYGFYEARRVAGLEDLRWHDLRHTGAHLAATAGATLAELMNRLGHSTAGAAMRYQHAVDERDADLARRLSLLAQASVANEPTD